MNTVISEQRRINEFVSFCIEMYAQKNVVSGSEVMDTFVKTGVLDYLFANYELLHTQGWPYILALINEYIEKQVSA
jgi:hypothetical protein